MYVWIEHSLLALAQSMKVGLQLKKKKIFTLFNRDLLFYPNLSLFTGNTKPPNEHYHTQNNNNPSNLISSHFL